MINSYSDYINLFLRPTGLGDRPCPGEHHFVSSYLVPRLYALNNRVPDYINPDGTKGIIGDVVYYKDHEHQFGIEVKLGTVRLTKGEFNEWIVSIDSLRWPHLFVAIGSLGIGLCSWADFRDTYIAAVRDKDEEWTPVMLNSGYGPQKSVDLLLPLLPTGSFYPYQASSREASEDEARFVEGLVDALDC